MKYSLAVVLFLIISGLLASVFPSGRTENILKYLLAVCAIFVICTAIVNIGNDSNLFDNISFETGSIDDFSVDINEQIIRQSEAAAESSVKKELEIRGLYLDFLEINMDISESDSIIITDISFTPNAVTPKDILKIAIYEITGCENIKEVEQ